MKNLLLTAFTLLSAVALSFPVLAEASTLPETPSLFFTSEELERIETEASKRPPEISPDGGIIKVGAILYYGPDDWAVWVQNELWTPVTNRPNLRIFDVKPGQIQLKIEAKTVILRPNETYNPLTGKVIKTIQ